MHYLSRSLLRKLAKDGLLVNPAVQKFFEDEANLPRPSSIKAQVDAVLDKAIEDADRLALPGASLARHALTLGVVASGIMVDPKLRLARGVRIEAASVLYQMALTHLPTNNYRARAWIANDLILVLKARSAYYRDPIADDLDRAVKLSYDLLLLPLSADLDVGRTLSIVADCHLARFRL